MSANAMHTENRKLRETIQRLNERIAELERKEKPTAKKVEVDAHFGKPHEKKVDPKASHG